MDKYEFNIKVEQIKKLVAKSDYETAMKIADTVDWRRVRNTNLLSMIASVYEKNEEYQVAKDILLMAFERAPLGKRLLYKLSELALKEGNVDEAEAYYREFCDLAPDDPRQNLLRYMILKAKGAPVAQLIHSLETYTEEELDEKWLYELAELYHQAGMGAQCVQLCDRIMLMFGLGKYVEKAMELKVNYAPLTNYQMDLVENRDKYEEKLRAVEQQFDGNMRVIPGRGADYPVEEPVSGPRPYQSIDGRAYRSAGVEPAGGGYQSIDGRAAGVASAGVYGEEGQPYPLYPQPEQAPYYGPAAQDGSFEEPGTGGEYGRPGFSYEPYEGSYSAEGERPNAAYMPGGPEDGREESRIMEERGFYDKRPLVHPVDDPFNTKLQTISDDELAVNLREAEVEANLAREMSRITVPSEVEEPSMMERTRILENIRSMKSILDMPAPARNETYSVPSEPTVEEDEEQGYPADYPEESAFENRERGYARTVAETHGEAGEYGREAAYEEASASSEESSDEGTEYERGDFGKEDGKRADDGKTDDGRIHDRKIDDSQRYEREAADRGSMEQVELEEDDEAPVSEVRNHLMIESRTPEKGLSLAVKALKQIHQELGIKNMVVKIRGDRLSRRGVMASADKLAGKDLIVENAGDLTETALDELNDLMEMDESGLIVVLIDNPRQMEMLHQKHPILARKFECIGSQEKEDDELAGVDVEIVEKAIYEQTKSQEAAAKGQDSGDTVLSQKEHPAVHREPLSERPAPSGGAVVHHAPPAGQKVKLEGLSAAGRMAERAAESGPYEEAEPAMPEKAAPAVAKKAAPAKPAGRPPVPVRPEPDEEEMEREPEDSYEFEQDSDGYQEEPQYEDEEEMGIDEFAQYACKYASDIDCSITGKSMLALYERIEIMEEDGIPLTKTNAEDLIEEAADKAEKPSIGKLLKGVFSSKYDKDGLLILKEEHFID